MTKEDIRRESEEKYNERLKQIGYKIKYKDETYNDGYLDGAEPREKRITELEEKNADLIGKVAFLENDLNNAKAQIEKMKCCGNCENRYGQEKCADCHNYSKWKFKQAEQFYEETAE